jgi:hypothetical protein
MTDALMFMDGNKTVHSFANQVFKCEGGFYSSQKVHRIVKTI